ncbi:hypothetical protein QBS70_04160 [Cronobacter sakazakii]|nr:hypothetical protein [Cronobacter sakazakii]
MGCGIRMGVYQPVLLTGIFACYRALLAKKVTLKITAGLLKTFFVTAFIAVVFIVLLFPTLWSTLVFGSLVSIGLVDTQPHYYRVDDEKFSPALFPQTVWQTQEMPGRDEKAFFYPRRKSVFHWQCQSHLPGLYCQTARAGHGTRLREFHPRQ